MSTEPKGKLSSHVDAEVVTAGTVSTDRQAWLSNLWAALEGARNLLAQFEDAPSTEALIERIRKLQDDVDRSRSGACDALDPDHPIWTELAPWIETAGEA